MTNLSDIIERLEKAEAGSHKLDEAIALSVVGMTKKNRLAEFPSHDPVWEFTDGRTSGSSHAIVPRYTTSVDAAISLAGKVLPGWAWKLGTCCVSDDAWVTPDFNSPVHGERLKREFPNLVAGSVFDAGVDIDLRPSGRPAIALCIAILTALKAKAQQQEGGE